MKKRGDVTAIKIIKNMSGIRFCFFESMPIIAKENKTTLIRFPPYLNITPYLNREKNSPEPYMLLITPEDAAIPPYPPNKSSLIIFESTNAAEYIESILVSS